MILFKSGQRLYLWMGVFGALGLALFIRFRGMDDPKSSAGRQPVPQRVHAYAVAPEWFREEVVTSGTVRALEQVDLRVQVSGKLEVLGFVESRFVTEGTLLLRVDAAEIAAELRRAERRRDLAVAKETRLAPLVESGGVSETEYDVARAEVSILEAEIDLIKEQMARYSVYAPFDGVVGLRYVSEGSYVTPSTRIASFQNTDQVRLDFSLPEKFSSKLSIGQNVRFTVVSEEMAFTAEIFAIEPEVDAATRMLQIRALASNEEGRLRPGASAQVIWEKAIAEEAILVPAVSVVQSEEGPAVFVASEGVAERRFVRLGERVRGRIRILEGIRSGERLITSGTEFIRSGTPVAIVSELPVSSEAR